MSMSVGASSSNALSYLQQLLQQGKAKSSDASKATDPLSMLMQTLSGGDGSSSGLSGATNSSALSAGACGPAFGSDTMATLISAQGQQASSGAESKFFAKLDSDGDGSISQSEFSAAAGNAGADSSVADAVFAKIDGNGDGAISLNELAKADQGGHHHRVGGGGPPPPDGGGAESLAGATTTTTTNADGSTTTTITYADGSKIDLTTPATASSGGDTDGDGDRPGGNSGKPDFSRSASNMLEQLIKLQSQMLNAASSTLSAVA